MRQQDEEFLSFWGPIFKKGLFWSCIIAILILGGCPRYRVWEQGLAGEAELSRAEQNRKIAIAQAQAKKEAASSLAEAEIIRANGVAKANQIIGESLKNNEAYLRYLWIQNLEHGGNQVIYIPTEAGLPILEASKRKDIEVQKK